MNLRVLALLSAFLASVCVLATSSATAVPTVTTVMSGPESPHTLALRFEVHERAASAAPANGEAGKTASSETLDPLALARVRTIRSEITARYSRPGGSKLVVTEASSTGVVESFTLLTPDLIETRIVAAHNGIYFAICPARATCPYPASRFARPAADPLPRRQALELALRTFLETSADVVAVSLPTPRFVLFIVERDELARDVDMPALAQALSGDLALSPPDWLQRAVDKVTRPRTFVSLGLEPTPTGRDTLTAAPRWPNVSAGQEGSTVSLAAAASPFELGLDGSRSAQAPLETLSFSSDGARSADTGTLVLRAVFAMASSDAACPPGTPPSIECHPRQGSGVVPGLGKVSESYVYRVDRYAPTCRVNTYRVVGYAARLIVAGKGEIKLAVDGRPECFSSADVLNPTQPFAITGGSGAYVGASGNGTLNHDAHFTPGGAAGEDTWVGTLVVPGLEFDVTAPALSGAVDRTVRAPIGAKRVRVGYKVTARDEVDGAVSATCQPRSGSRFTIGRTRVKCSATDTSGNTQTAKFTITVNATR